ncbi:hypothetical protein LJK87_18265 [Paenibacillus sp. P25]|nr:hypothetical protein LJK87_18265 [Paenibacillus sp. P25]
MEEKKKIIIREIEHWRRSRSLPEQYCDFLLNIYLEDGQEKPKATGLFGMDPGTIRNSNWKIWVLLFGSLAGLSFIALHFNAFELPMQIGVAFLILSGLYLWGGSKRTSEPVASQILLGMASLFLLFIGVYLLRLHGVDASVTIVSYVTLCGFLWMVTGLAARLALFQYCGWVGLVFCYGWSLHYQLDSLSWMTLELSWSAAFALIRLAFLDDSRENAASRPCFFSGKPDRLVYA